MGVLRSGNRTGRRRILWWVLGCLAFVLLALGLAIAFFPAIVRAVYAGRVLGAGELAYRHPSVRWVWRSGHELGWMMGIIPHIRRIYIKKVVAGEGCVHVWGGAPGCIFGTSTRHAATLDLGTGRSTYGKSTGREAEYLPLDWDGTRWIGTWAGVTWILPGPTRELHVAAGPAGSGKPLRLLALSGDEHLGVSLCGLRFPDGTLVLATFDGYIVCIDLEALRPSLGSPRGSATGPGEPPRGKACFTRPGAPAPSAGSGQALSEAKGIGRGTFVSQPTKYR